MNSENNNLKSFNQKIVSVQQIQSLSLNAQAQSDDPRQSSISPSIQGGVLNNLTLPEMKSSELISYPANPTQQEIQPIPGISVTQTQGHNHGEQTNNHSKEIRRKLQVHRKEARKYLKKIQKFFKNGGGENNKELFQKMAQINKQATELLKKNNSL